MPVFMEFPEPICQYWCHVPVAESPTGRVNIAMAETKENAELLCDREKEKEQRKKFYPTWKWANLLL